MASRSPSVVMRAELRRKILARVKELALSQSAAAERLGLSRAQMSRLVAGADVFSLDRLVDAAVRVDLKVRLQATRPYEAG